MRREYDFSKGVRGKFFRENVRLLIPVYLEPDVQAAVEARASKDGVAVTEVVNRVLERAMAGGDSAQPAKASARTELLLLGAAPSPTRRSAASGKTYATRETATGRFVPLPALRENPAQRASTKRPAAAAKKTAKRGKR